MLRGSEPALLRNHQIDAILAPEILDAQLSAPMLAVFSENAYLLAWEPFPHI